MKSIEITAHFYLEAIPGGDWNQKIVRLCHDRPAVPMMKPGRTTQLTGGLVPEPDPV